MKKAVILMFSIYTYDIDKLTDKTDDELYDLAKAGVEDGDCGIEVIEEFCSDINDGEDCLSLYYVFPVYLEENEYDEWRK